MLERLFLGVLLFLTSLFKSSPTLEVSVVKTTPIGLFAKINQYRASLKLPAFAGNACQNNTHGTLVSIGKYATTNEILARLLQEPVIKTSLADPRLDQLCITDTGDNLSLLLAQTLVVTPMPKIDLQVAPVPTSFTEDQLWQALVIYRQAHQAHDLTKDDKLCKYAEKRVNDQIAMMATVKLADYPNPDKYPLDGHQGFSKDATSGVAFDVTGTTRLAENLAYYPGAQTATQIIEWGWDSSTEGHRETQLSNDWTKACIAGKAGFYSAIFGS